MELGVLTMGIGVWRSRCHVPVTFGCAEKLIHCSRFEPGDKSHRPNVRFIEAFFDPAHRQLHRCGVVCPHFIDRGDLFFPRSECAVDQRPCSFAPRVWPDKQLTLA